MFLGNKVFKAKERGSRFMLALDMLVLCFYDRIMMPKDWTNADTLRALHSFAMATGMIILYKE